MARQKTLRRVDRLRSLTGAGGDPDIDRWAEHARRTMWSSRRPKVIRIRPGLVLRGKQAESSLRAVSASKSAAVQLLLLSIFENQCRSPKLVGEPNTLPLTRPTDEETTAWDYLLAIPTKDAQDRYTDARPTAYNRVEQIKSALRRLEQSGRVGLPPRQVRNRYQPFRLLNEVANNHQGKIYYKTPGPPTIDVPVEFFLAGWVHALYDNEIIAYLFLLHHAQMRPEENSGEGMPLARAGWADAFGQERAYTAYRELERFGLVTVIRDPRRRGNGQLVGLREESDVRAMDIAPHRFKVDPSALNRRAVPVVVDALEASARGIDIELANMVRPRSVELIEPL